jgi:hypothetical protein
MTIVHQIDKINLFPPFFAKASATFLFLPPTAIHDIGYSISKIMLQGELKESIYFLTACCNQIGNAAALKEGGILNS